MKNLHCRLIEFQIDNPCYSNPCSQLCMLNQNKGYTCGCTLDKKLNADKHTCQGKFVKEIMKYTKSLEHINICCINKIGMVMY